MLEMVHRVLTYRVSVAALIGVGFLIGFPYLLVGVLLFRSVGVELSGFPRCV
jgi:hypothetical protein